MKPYENRFVVGEKVRIADLEELQRFKRDWKSHNPLADEQLPFAGRVAKVEALGFYHGGDVIYGLKRTPGTWHEDCLRSLTDRKPQN